MKPPTVKLPSSNEEPDPEPRPVAIDLENDPLQSFAPENRQAGQPSVGPTAPTAAAKPRLFDPQAIAGFGVFVDAINDVEKHLEQHLTAVEGRLAALDERNRRNEERLTGCETIVAETRANVRALDNSIETRLAKETRVAQQKATSYRVDSLPSPAPRQPRRSGRQPLLALAVVAVAVLALIGIVTMRSRGDVNQIAARTTDPLPPSPAPMVTSVATPFVPAAPPDPAPAILTASAVPAASPVPTVSPVKLPTAAPADPPRPRRVAAPTSSQVATPQTERPANREQALPKPPQRPIEQRPLFHGTLAVRSAPDGAAVFLNGREVGTTPLKLPGVRAGNYALRLEHEGYQRWTMSVLVPADKQTDINAKLDTPDVRWR